MTLFQECKSFAPYRSVIWKFDRSNIKPAHFHGQIEMMIIRSGTANVQLGKKDYKLSQGNLVWVLPGHNHLTNNFSDDFDMWIVIMEPEYIQQIALPFVNCPDLDKEDSPYLGWLPQVTKVVSAKPILKLKNSGFAHLENMCNSAYQSQNSDDKQAFIEKAVAAAWSATMQEVPDLTDKISISQHATVLMYENLDLNQEEICDKMGITASYLSRSLKSDLGYGFVEHRARVRVASFLAFLRRENWTMTRAALASGFGSYAQFYRTFVQVTGWKPRDYVAQNGRNKIAEIKQID